jgi:hypothetical protein
MFWRRVITGSLLATGVHAGIGGLMVEGMTRNSPSVERRLAEIAKASLRARGGVIEARKSTGPLSNVVLNQDGTINMTMWETQVNAACIEALSDLPEASNPSGTCVCYNLPAMNNVTGAFEADLRLYRISAPSGQFASIPPENIQVSLSYRGASVSPVSPETASQAVSAQLGRRQNTSSTMTGDSGIQLLRTYLFVGQIDRAQIAGPLSLCVLSPESELL